MLRSCTLFAALLASSPVLSADLALRGAIADDLPALGASFGGVYAGAHAGFTAMKPRYEEDHPQYDINPTIGGFRGGALAGYNLQIGELVAGVEADVSFGALSEGPDRGAAFNNYTKITQSWQGNARLRLGYAVNNALFFVAAGASLARFSVDDVDPGFGRSRKNDLGWTLGAGVDYALSPSWAVRGEYLFASFGRKGYDIVAPKDCDTFLARMNPHTHTLRFALMYRFGADEAAAAPVVAARY